MSVMLEGISEETLEAIKKAQTAGVLATTGLFGYDLSGPVSLVPVNTPWYERIARKTAPQGSDAAYWRAILNINNTQPSPFVGRDAGGNFINVKEQDVLAKYQPVRVSGKVTKDAIRLYKGYADAKAIATTHTLMQWRLQENKALFGGQNFALPATATPTLADSATGGSINANTAVYVKCAARSAYNYYWGGSNVASSAVTVTTANDGVNTHKVTATVTAVRGAVAYDWFVSGDDTTYYYLTTTTVNKVVYSAVISAHQAVPTTIPGLNTTAVTTPPIADTSYSADSYNGLIASLAGSYLDSTGALVTYGTGSSTVSGATITSLNGATMTASSQGVTEVDSMLLSIWNAAQLSPSAMIMNAQQAQDLSTKVLGSGYALTQLTAADPGRKGITAGGVVSRYVNRASGGNEVEILVDPAFPQGSIAFVTEQVPYPDNMEARTFEARCLEDVTQTAYGAALTAGGAGAGPREEWDCSSMETFINRAPVTCGLLSNIENG